MKEKEVNSYYDQSIRANIEVHSAMAEQYNKVDQEFDQKREECRLYKDGETDNEKIRELKNFLDNELKRPPRDHQVKAACHLYLAGNGANFSL